MLGLCWDKTYGAMTNYGDRDGDGDDNENNDGNEDDNVTSGLRSDGPIFNPITTPCSCR